MVVVTEETDRLLSRMPGMIRRKAHIHGHVRFGAGGETLARNWLLTPYDADHGFCLRHPPRAGVIRAAAVAGRAA